jgi:hypothetical protein
MEGKSRYLQCLKQTVLELVADITDNIVKSEYRPLCGVFGNYFNTYPELALMKDSIEILLPKKGDVSAKRTRVIGEVLPQLFLRVVGKEIPLSIDYEELSEQDLASIWNYLEVMLVITESYKKNP